MFNRKKQELCTCSRCGLVYDGRYVEERYRHLCPEHRKEPMESDRKKAEVRCWAERNWEKLYEQAKSENAALAQSYGALAAGSQLQAQLMMGGGNPYIRGDIGASGSVWSLLGMPLP